MLNFAHTAVAFFLSVFTNKTAADGALSAKISEELAYEKEAASEGAPDFLKTFNESGIWTVGV